MSLDGREVEVSDAEQAVLDRAAKQPLDVDISDYGDEYVAGFLRGQVNALQYAILTADPPDAFGELADARTQIERLQARNVALERVVEIIANPAADAAHSVRCVEKGWQDRGEGCYCQQDPRDPDDVLTEARAALAALEDTTDG